MHGIAKRGIALVAATSGLVLGSAAVAAADSAGTAETSHSGGSVSGWAAQAPVNLPVKLCGQNVQAGAVKELLKGTVCGTGQGVTATASSDHTPGTLSGDLVQGTLSAPLLFCGWNVNAAAHKDVHDGSTCTANANGPGSTATAAVTDSGGFLSGDVVQIGVDMPVIVCGDDVTLGTSYNVYQGSTCTD